MTNTQNGQWILYKNIQCICFLYMYFLCQPDALLLDAGVVVAEPGDDGRGLDAEQVVDLNRTEHLQTGGNMDISKIFPYLIHDIY